MTLGRRTSVARTSARIWSRKFADAFRGLWRALRTQSSFAVHLGMAAAVVAAGAFFGVSAEESGSGGDILWQGVQYLT